MKRRAMLAGTGMLVTGSGIIGTSAAFGNSVTAASSFRVITAKSLRVRAGQAFAADGSVNEGYEDRFVAYEETADSMFFDNTGGLNNISKEDIPVATVNPRDQNNNDELVLESAISVNSDGVVFEDILEIQNLGTSTESVGISYDRDKNQYGDDVNVGGGDDELNDLDVQSVYRFVDNNDNRISPDQDTLGSGVDDPAAFVEIEPNETHPIDLKIDFSEYGNRFVDGTPKENILQAAQLGDPFEGSTDTVDLLDSITVGTEDT
jgi:hypothetical protein